MSYSFSIMAKDYMSGPLMKAYQSVSKLEEKVGSMQAKSLQATASAGSGFDNLSGKINKTEGEFKDLENQSERTGNGLHKIVGIAGRLFVAFGAFQTIRALFDMGVDAEQTNIKFEVLLGSAEKAKNMLVDINQYANSTPYENMGLQKAAETMLGFGIAQEKIMPNMKMLGDVAMGNKEKLSGLSLVYSQIMATGRLMGQDLLQLINQGFNPLQVISEQTGLSMLTLKNQMEKGAISAGMIEEAFRIATSEGGRYYQMADKMSVSAGGKWSTLLGKGKEAAKGLGLQLAQALIPMIDLGIKVVDFIPPFVEGLKNTYQWLSSNEPLLIFLASILTAIGVNLLVANAGAIALSATMGILNGVMWLVNTATAMWNFILSMNPISIVIIAIGALVAAVVLLWNKFDWFRGGVMGVWEVLKGLGDVIKNYVINRINELLQGIAGVGQALSALRKGDFTAAWELGKGAVGNLMGVNSKAEAFNQGKEAFKSFSSGYDKGVAMKGAKASNPLGIKIPEFAGQQAKSSMFDDLLGGGADAGKDKKGKTSGAKLKGSADNIISGGKKQTTFNISINKLQDKTEIHVSSVEKGIDRLGEKVQEELLRAINSINQMQVS